MPCLSQNGWTLNWADFGFLLTAQSAGMWIFIVDTFILFYIVLSLSLFHLWNNKVFNYNEYTFKQSCVCGRKDESLLEYPLVEEALTSARPHMMSCALWDGNGPHNQLELRITAALWVPLQSHPPKQASGRLRLIQLKEKEIKVIKKWLYVLCLTRVSSATWFCGSRNTSASLFCPLWFFHCWYNLISVISSVSQSLMSLEAVLLITSELHGKSTSLT